MSIFRKKELRIGQIWLEKPTGNPFEKPNFCAEIRDIKNGWVLIQEHWAVKNIKNLPDPPPWSCRESYFRSRYGELLQSSMASIAS